MGGEGKEKGGGSVNQIYYPVIERVIEPLLTNYFNEEWAQESRCGVLKLVEAMALKASSLTGCLLGVFHYLN